MFEFSIIKDTAASIKFKILYSCMIFQAQCLLSKTTVCPIKHAP